MLKNFSLSTILGLTFGVLLAGYAVFAFTPPTVAPTGGNTLAPINVGVGSQVKSGGLWVGSLGTDGGVTIGGDISWVGNLTSGAVPWGSLTSVPSGLSDGDQVGITSESDPQVGVVTSGKWCRGDGGAVQCDQAAPLGLTLHDYASNYSGINTGNCSGSPGCSGDLVTLNTTTPSGDFIIIASAYLDGGTQNFTTNLTVDGTTDASMSWDYSYNFPSAARDYSKTATVVRSLSAGSHTLKISYTCNNSIGCSMRKASIIVLGPL